MVSEEEIKRIALKNAIEHDGKADEKVVLSKLIGSDKSLIKQISQIKEIVSNVVSAVNATGYDQQIEEAKRLGLSLEERKSEEKPDLKPLPNVNKEVILRLPPEPSGYMHLGHAISGMINYIYKEKYNGKLWLRFEDTNPNKVREEFFDSFKEGYSWLGIKWDQEKKISDDMNIIYEYAERMIKEGKAYACECDAETIKKNRIGGIECKCRSNSIEYNLEKFRLAIEGKAKPGEITIRFKGDMRSKDFSLRDPSLLRIVETKYKPYHLWPLYDFASVIEDHLCGITHILRSNEFKTSLQDKLREALGFEKPTVVQFSRFNFTGTPFSKRKIRALIEAGYIKDWSDIRLPTVSAIRRRGIQPQAIREFVLHTKYSLSEHEYSWDLLLTLNRRIIDSIAKRLFFVDSPVRLYVEDAGEVIANIRNHPSVDMGRRTIQTDGNFFISKADFEAINAGENVRLKDLYAIRIKEKGKDEIYAIKSEKNEGKIIHWVPAKRNQPIKVIKVGNLLENGKFNEKSLIEINGLAEEDVKLLDDNAIVQFERFGFCRLDNKEKMEFIFISD